MALDVQFPSRRQRPLSLLAPAAGLVCVALVALAPFTAGCGGSAGGAASPPPSSLPAYRGENADLFDDTIEPHAVGLELETYASPKNDPRFRARAQAGDTVIRARIKTVTGEGGSYQLSFKTLAVLGGKRPLGDEFTVRVDRTSPSLGIVKSMEGQLVGKTLVVFAKAFARTDADREIHFHAAPDAAEVAAAVKEAVILDEVK
jgi:hypothetical protein